MPSGHRITIEDIFQTVCDLPLEQRPTYLEEACAGDDDLRREVEVLLKYYDTDNSFLENRALDDAAKQFAAAASSGAPAMIGREIEHYRILALLGKGGMGEVYLARDTNLDADVAIKFLPAAYADDPEWQARFDREGRLQAALRHANIAAILHKGQADGRPFLVFEYIAGETLEERLERGPLPNKEALQIFKQIATALEYAHKFGIIHRDLKPANIKITPEGVVKVLDFGIAKKISADLSTIDLTATLATNKADDETRDFGQTRKGEVIGTVAYMSPEQTWGERLDHRTDIWSFGCVLYEALSGRRPFKGIDTYDTLNSIRHGEPDWQALPARTPKPIRELLRQTLRKDPRQRLRAATEMKRTIERTLAPPRFWPQQLKHQAALVMMLVVLISAAFASGAWLRSWWTRSAIPVEKQLIVLPFKGFNNEQAGAGFADELRRNLLSVSDDWQAAPPAETAQANLLNLDLQNITRKFGANLIVGGEVQQAGEQIRIKYWVRNSYLYTLKEAEVSGPSYTLSELQNEIARQLAERLNLKSSGRAEVFSRQLKLSHADATEQYLIAIGELQKDLNRESVERPIEILTRLIQSEGDSARFQSALAQAYLNKYEFTGAPDWAEKALQACERAISLSPNQPETYQVSRGLVYMRFGKYAEALNDFKAALESHPRDWEAWQGRAFAYQASGKLVEAEDAYAQVIKLWPNYWAGYNELGAYYYAYGQYDKAINTWQRVIDLLPDSPTGYNNIAAAYFQIGETERAQQSFLTSITKDRTRDNNEAYAGLGTIYFYLGRYAEALNYFRTGIELVQQAGRQDAVLLGNLADAYRQLARLDAAPNLSDEYSRRAANAYEQAIGIYRQSIEKGIEDAQALAYLAQWLAKRSQLDEAIKFLKLAIEADAQDIEVAYSATIVYLLAGNTEQAWHWFERTACGGHSSARLAHDPELQTMRSEGRYQAIITKCQK